jgi:para-aminobenzoate synthetase / 4-amino-4-deoxychorismate lyase
MDKSRSGPYATREGMTDGISRARFDAFDPRRPGWTPRAFAEPLAMHAARRLDEVEPVLREAQRAADQGRWAVVALAYEAAPAFERALAPSRHRPAWPLALVSVFEAPRPPEIAADAGACRLDLEPAVTRERFVGAVRRVQDEIAAGHTYQVNLTFPLRGAWNGDAAALYRRLGVSQRAGYAALLECGPLAIVSASPELFVERSQRTVRTRPMKGTSPRGRWRGEDEVRAEALRHCEKARAENVMIVDLLRNDIGRLAQPGSVAATELFALERYPTLWQMTSTVEGTLLERGAGLVDLMRALFPSGSITGAPKIRTMSIIEELEQGPRGFYTGTVGYVAPGGDCVFNVAIRTIVCDAATGTATLGVGAGITADSDPGAEYDECLLKAAFVHAAGMPDFELLETMLLEDGRIWLLDRHLARLYDSASYLDFRLDPGAAAAALDAVAREHRHGRWRVRLLAGRDGAVRTECLPPGSRRPGVARIELAARPVSSGDVFLFHKTTHRAAYAAARAERPEADDVVLWNERGEITESTIANVVMDAGGELLTPARACGLLAGTLRAELLAAGSIREAVITMDQLRQARRLWLINSVQGWVEAGLIGN